MPFPKDQMAFWEPVLQGSEEKRLIEVLRSRYWNDGEITRSFESEIARKLDVPYAVAVSSGTGALFLALKALGIGAGDEVLVPDVTFVATANAVILAGAKPVLVDVNPETFNMDLQAAERCIHARTKAILIVHVSGRGEHVTTFQDLARKRDLFLIEDAAQAFGSQVEKQSLGTFGEAGCFSFSPNKIMTTGQGGVVVTRDAKIHERLRKLKDQGRRSQGTGGADVHEEIGFNFKLTNLQAALGLAQLEDLEKRTMAMREIYRAYREHLRDLPEVKLFSFAIDKGESPQWVDAVVERRDDLMRYLQEAKMICRPYWFPLHTQSPYQQKDTDFPVSSAWVQKALWFPSLFTLMPEQIREVCRRVREFYGTK